MTGENGLTFEVFDARSELPLRLTFIHEDTDESLTMPPEFLQRGRIGWQEGGRTVSIAVEWQKAEIVTVDSIDVPSWVSSTQVLAPGDRVHCSGVIRREDSGTPFGLAEHRLTLDLGSAVRTLQSPAGTEWNGRIVERGEVTLRVLEVRNAADVRRKRMHDAARAAARDDYATALREYLQVLRDDPGGIDAHAGAGKMYMWLGRFREAVIEFEQVLPSYVGVRSALPSYLAFSYLSVGDSAKAEALLRSAYGPEGARRELEVLRAAVRRGVK
jgi:hypothetical protein